MGPRAVAMIARPVPSRHWRCYGDHPLPSGPEALDEPLAAFPSWYLRIVCEPCGKERMVSEVHLSQRALPLRDILDRARHDDCGGRAGRAELLTGIEGRPASQCARSCCARGEDEGGVRGTAQRNCTARCGRRGGSQGGLNRLSHVPANGRTAHAPTTNSAGQRDRAATARPPNPLR